MTVALTTISKVVCCRAKRLLSLPQFPLPLEQLAQTCGRLIAVQSARCDIENKAFPLIGGQFRARQQIIALEENQTGSERSAFVSVDEGVISAKIKKVGSGDFYRVGDERLPHHRRLRRCHRRFK